MMNIPLQIAKWCESRQRPCGPKDVRASETERGVYVARSGSQVRRSRFVRDAKPHVRPLDPAWKEASS